MRQNSIGSVLNLILTGQDLFTDWGEYMLSLSKSNSGILVLSLISLALTISPAFCQTDSGDKPEAEKKLEDQLKSDSDKLSHDKDQLEDYKAQAAWYEEFAKQRLANASAERLEVEKRLKLREAALAKLVKKDPKNHIVQEVEALKAWLADETAKRRQIESTRDRWRAAVQNLQGKIGQDKYAVDVDSASLEHQKELDKEKAARNAENPKPAPPQIQQNTILLPGFEQEQGNIPTLLGPAN